MNTNKQRPSSPADNEQLKWSAEEEIWLSEQQRHLRLMMTRALVTYFVLFLVFGVIMSLFGLDPLVKGGLMPKALFIFVGLSLLIAVINTVVDASKEQGESWFNVLRSLVRHRSSSKKSKYR